MIDCKIMGRFFIVIASEKAFWYLFRDHEWCAEVVAYCLMILKKAASGKWSLTPPW